MPWWKSTLCPGSRRSASTKVTQAAQTESSWSRNLTILITLNRCKFSYKVKLGVHLRKCNTDFRPHEHYSSPGSMCVFRGVCAAKVACVKSRDMHWALVAHRDQRDINLSSLRMLVVADGSNPCKDTSCHSPNCGWGCNILPLVLPRYLLHPLHLLYL